MSDVLTDALKRAWYTHRRWEPLAKEVQRLVNEDRASVVETCTDRFLCRNRIMMFLRANQGQFLTHEVIAARTHMSRETVSKNMKKLIQLGRVVQLRTSRSSPAMYWVQVPYTREHG